MLFLLSTINCRYGPDYLLRRVVQFLGQRRIKAASLDRRRKVCEYESQ